MTSLNNFLSGKLARRKDEGLLRTLVVNEGLVDFFSNDYLGLARSEALARRITQTLEKIPSPGNGATGSRLLSGNSVHHEELERFLAGIFKTEAALLFNSGYAANQAVLSAIPQKNDAIFYDELAHACIKDGARLSLAARYPFRHNDLEDLEKKIGRSAAVRKFIAVESVYSMDGDQCPLQDLVGLAERNNATIILDEAHTTGVVGSNGSGLAVSLGLADKIGIRIHTFGKAMGVHGACVAGSTALTQYLINFARPFIYTTALPLHSVISIRSAFDHLGSNMQLQKLLQDRIHAFLKNAAFNNRTLSQSAIQTVLLPGNDRVKKVSHQLRESGFDVRPILSPTVPKTTERIRICLHTFNAEDEIKNLTRDISRIIEN